MGLGLRGTALFVLGIAVVIWVLPEVLRAATGRTIPSLGTALSEFGGGIASLGRGVGAAFTETVTRPLQELGQLRFTPVFAPITGFGSAGFFQLSGEEISKLLFPEKPQAPGTPSGPAFAPSPQVPPGSFPPGPQWGGMPPPVGGYAPLAAGGETYGSLEQADERARQVGGNVSIVYLPSGVAYTVRTIF